MNPMLRSVLDCVVYGLYRATAWVVGLLPERSLPPLAATLAGLFALCQPGRIRTARANIRLALGDRFDDAAQAQLARDSVRQFILSALELVRLRNYADRIDEIIRIEGLEHLDAALARGRGVIFLTAHFGLWDLGGAWLARHGYHPYAVARVMDNPYLDRDVAALRDRFGIATIPQRTAMKDMLRVLRAGGILGLLADQHASHSCVVVPFFGQPAATVTSVARLVQQTGAAVVVGGVVRVAPMRHVGHIYPIVEMVRTDNRELDVLENTAAINRAYERMILDHPDHWLWIHRRWKALDRIRRQSTDSSVPAVEGS